MEQNNGMIKYTLWAGTLIPVSMILIVGFIIYVQFNQQDIEYQWVEHTDNVIVNAHVISEHLVDMEISQRNYLISGSKPSLEKYETGISIVTEEITYLKTIVRDELVQISRLNSIQRLVEDWIRTEGTLGIEARNQYDQGRIPFTEMEKLLNSDVGERDITDIKSLLSDFIADEEDHKTKRRSLALSATNTTKIISAMSVIAIVLVSLVTGWYSVRTVLFQSWIRLKHSSILSELQGITDIEELSNALLEALLPVIRARMGSLYIFPKADEGLGRLAGTYGTTDINRENDHIKMEQGLVGQCYTSRKMITINDIPESHFDIHTSLGQSRPSGIVLIPVKYKDQVVAIIEFAYYSAMEKKEKLLIKSLSESLGVIINSAIAWEKTEALFNKTLEQKDLIQESELRNAAIINNSVDGVITIDNQGTIESFSQSAKDIFDYCSDEIIGKNIKKLIPHPYEDDFLMKISSTGKKSIFGAGSGIDAMRKDSSIFPVVLSISQVVLQGRDLFVGTITDITEEKQSRDEIERKSAEAQEARFKAEEANRVKSEFLANMSHELRTPLNSLLILARELKDNCDGNLSEVEVEDAGVIFDSGNDLLALINDVLDLAKVESGKMSATIETVSLREIVDSTKAKFTHVASQKNLELHFNIDKSVPDTIVSDRLRIDQILRNFLSNAFKFTHEGSVSINITVPDRLTKFYEASCRPDDMIAFAIKDTGIGIPAETQERVFEAFQQADGSTTREYGGTGLGLSISRELASLLGGEVHLESEEQVGSTFTLYIQRNLQQGKHHERRIFGVSRRKSNNFNNHSLLDSSSTSTTLPNPMDDDRDCLENGITTILVVDDDRRFAKIIREKIRARGYKALVATDGNLGLRLVERYKPDALILDINLPQIDGITVYEAIRSNEKTDDLPVYFMSVLDDAPAICDDKAVGFLSKPVSSEQLERAFCEIESLTSEKIHHLLVVEDDKNMRHAMRKMLKGRNIKISEAVDGVEALQFLNTESPDCILLDLMMPKMDGISLLQEIGESEVISMPRVIVYSAKDLTDEEAEIIERYTTNFIHKNSATLEDVEDRMFSHISHQSAANTIDIPEDEVSAEPVDTHTTNVSTISALPVLPDATLAREESDGTTHNIHYDFGGKKLLITDDQARNIFALSRLLARSNLEIHTAKDGQEALDYLREHPDTDCVIMDMMMPVMNGYEAIESIREKDEWDDLPIIAVTAKAMEDDKDKCIKSGASAYISKPVDKDVLLSTLAIYLDQKAA